MDWIQSLPTLVLSVVWVILVPFAQIANFLDPQLTEDGQPYGPFRYKQIVNERYLIAKHGNISYADTSNITPLERQYILEFITDELQRQHELYQKRMAEIETNRRK